MFKKIMLIVLVGLIYSGYSQYNICSYTVYGWVMTKDSVPIPGMKISITVSYLDATAPSGVTTFTATQATNPIPTDSAGMALHTGGRWMFGYQLATSATVLIKPVPVDGWSFKPDSIYGVYGDIGMQNCCTASHSDCILTPGKRWQKWVFIATINPVVSVKPLVNMKAVARSVPPSYYDIMGRKLVENRKASIVIEKMGMTTRRVFAIKE
ncbi:MAG: hypothetical protein HQK96_07680 [Nitrospirae bacterium]|nr:hypothetical protein [Nitrospirota bacterium]